MDFESYPSGILTFLFTDIQGSTPLWEKDPAGMGEALELHNVASREAIELDPWQTVGELIVNLGVHASESN